MLKFLKVSLFSIVLLFTGSCADNALSEFADENDPAALAKQAAIYINEGNYTKAKEYCTNTSGFDRDELYICATAYAGACGLEVIPFLTTTIAGATDPLLEYFLTTVSGTTLAQATDCESAQNLLESIGVALNRTDDENFLMSMINLKTLQVLSDLYADTDDDGLRDGGYNSCTLGDPIATIYASALWELKESAPNTGITELSDVATVIENACSVIDAVDSTRDFCAATDANTFTASQLNGARAIVSEDTVFGLSDCGAGVAFCCP